MSVVKNVRSSGDRFIQWHLATDAFKTGGGGVLFQLPLTDHETEHSAETLDNFKVVMFLGCAFTSAEQDYYTEEREALAVLRCLQEVRRLVRGSP